MLVRWLCRHHLDRHSRCPDKTFTGTIKLLSLSAVDGNREFSQGHCQSKVAGLSYSTEDRGLGLPELTPLGKCSGAVELEIIP